MCFMIYRLRSLFHIKRLVSPVFREGLNSNLERTRDRVSALLRNHSYDDVVAHCKYNVPVGSASLGKGTLKDLCDQQEITERAGITR